MRSVWWATVILMYVLTSSSSWCIARNSGAAPRAMSASETSGITVWK